MALAVGPALSDTIFGAVDLLGVGGKRNDRREYVQQDKQYEAYGKQCIHNPQSITQG